MTEEPSQPLTPVVERPPPPNLEPPPADPWSIMMTFTKFDQVTGRIEQTGQMSLGALQHLAETASWYVLTGREGKFETEYVVIENDKPVIKQRPANPVTLDANGVLNNIPSPSRIVIKDDAGIMTVEEVTDTQIQLETDFPGRHTINVQSFPYLDVELEWNAK